MNERIRQILLQVVPMAGEDGEYLPSLHTPEDIERFAELIVLECEKVSLKNSHRDDDMGAIIARQIKQHFGVNHERTN